MYIGLHVNCRLVLSNFFTKLEFSRHLFEKHKKCKIFMKNLLLAAHLFHAKVQTDRRTEVTKLIITLRNVTNAPNNAQSNQTTITVPMFSLDVQLCPVLRFRSCRQATAAACHTLYIERADGYGPFSAQSDYRYSSLNDGDTF